MSPRIGLMLAGVVLSLLAFGGQSTPGKAAPAPGPVTPPGGRAGAPQPPAWGIVTSPNPGSERDDLRGVWAAGATEVWAAGFAAGDDGIERALILHNTGSGWTVAPSPNGSLSDNYLFGISGSAANDIWAVGYMLSPDGYQPLTLHWNGSAWSVVPVATAGPGTYYLYGVNARAANDVWAVGTVDAARHTLVISVG